MTVEGMYFDELSKIRVLQPEVLTQTEELKEECKQFVDKIGEFQTVVGGFINIVDRLAKQVEQEKMKVNCSILNKALQCMHTIGAVHLVDIKFGEHRLTDVQFVRLAIGARNTLKSIAKERESHKHQLQTLITEKKIQMERLRLQYESLLQVEEQQNEFIENFAVQK